MNDDNLNDKDNMDRIERKFDDQGKANIAAHLRLRKSAWVGWMLAVTCAVVIVALLSEVL